ncbi:hypothetical protein ACRRRV_16015, partial [Methylococcus sp. S1B]
MAETFRDWICPPPGMGTTVSQAARVGGGKPFSLVAQHQQNGTAGPRHGFGGKASGMQGGTDDRELGAQASQRLRRAGEA